MKVRLGAFAGAAVAVGGLGIVAVAPVARADRFTVSYTCSVPLLGARPVVVSGALDFSPTPPTVGEAVRFWLRITSLSLRAPIPINAWSATAEVVTQGAQNGSFRLRGSGGWVPARRPISGRLTGVWTPTAAGVTWLKTGAIMIKANVSLVGDVLLPCLPRGDRTVLATLTVADRPIIGLAGSRSPVPVPSATFGVRRTPSWPPVVRRR